MKPRETQTIENTGIEKITITIGESAREFRIGDYLNAIDELTCWFHCNTMVSADTLALALRLYSEYLIEEN